MYFSKFYLVAIVVAIMTGTIFGEEMEHQVDAEQLVDVGQWVEEQMDETTNLRTSAVPEQMLAQCQAKLATMGRINGCSCPTSIMKNFYAYCIFFDHSCDHHDACYHLRGVTKSACDSKFKSDLKNQCPKFTVNYYFGKKRIFEPTCYSNAMGFYYAVKNSGTAASAYEKDQKFTLDNNIKECQYGLSFLRNIMNKLNGHLTG